jgi:hypothetical protein
MWWCSVGGKIQNLGFLRIDRASSAEKTFPNLGLTPTEWVPPHSDFLFLPPEERFQFTHPTKGNARFRDFMIKTLWTWGSRKESEELPPIRIIFAEKIPETGLLCTE